MKKEQHKEKELTPLQKSLAGRKPVAVEPSEVKEPVEPNSWGTGKPKAEAKKDGE
jgi:hypothetical protein